MRPERRLGARLGRTALFSRIGIRLSFYFQFCNGPPELRRAPSKSACSACIDRSCLVGSDVLDRVAYHGGIFFHAYPHRYVISLLRACIVEEAIFRLVTFTLATIIPFVLYILS